jgi:hypothetical protein
LYLIPLIGRHRKNAASDGRVLYALATPPFLSSLHGMCPCGLAGIVAQTGLEQPSNYRGNAVKRARTRRVCPRFLRTQDSPFYHQSLPCSLPQSVLPLTNPPMSHQTKNHAKKPIFQVEPTGTKREIFHSEGRVPRVPISALPSRILSSPTPNFVDFSPAQLPVNQRPSN